MIITSKLFKGCKNGKRKYQEALYRHVFTDVVRIALRYVHNQSDAEDILNRSMLKVFIKIEDFHGDHENFGGWIRRIVINESLNFLKAKKNKEDLIDDNQQVAEFALIELDEEDPSYILVMLKSLPERSATVFTLFVIEGYSHKEISELLEITVANSKWHLHEAKKKLKGWINEIELV